MLEFDLFKDWIPSITEKRRYMFDDEYKVEEIERKYPSFMINRALSQYEDTIFIANEVNRMASVLDPKLQYDFLYYLVPKKRRYAKWAKAKKIDEINTIVEVYNISTRKAEEIIDLLDEEDIRNLKDYTFKGGKSK